MNDILTVDEIQARYDGEWILLGEPQTDAATNAVLAGRVLHHSKDRDEVYGEAVRLRLPRFAVLCFATMPPDMAIIL